VRAGTAAAFLSDKASQLSMTMAEIGAAFGVGQSTASEGPGHLGHAAHALHGPDRDAAVNGVLVDFRDMPREAQVIANERRMIPNIPPDQEASCRDPGRASSPHHSVQCTGQNRASLMTPHGIVAI
jgi:hypothetical protein